VRQLYYVSPRDLALDPPHIDAHAVRPSLLLDDEAHPQIAIVHAKPARDLVRKPAVPADCQGPWRASDL
jgi:hypothetical protein